MTEPLRVKGSYTDCSKSEEGFMIETFKRPDKSREEMLGLLLTIHFPGCLSSLFFGSASKY